MPIGIKVGSLSERLIRPLRSIVSRTSSGKASSVEATSLINVLGHWRKIAFMSSGPWLQKKLATYLMLQKARSAAFVFGPVSWTQLDTDKQLFQQTCTASPTWKARPDSQSRLLHAHTAGAFVYTAITAPLQSCLNVSSTPPSFVFYNICFIW